MGHYKQPGLLRASRQLREETKRIYQEENTFEIVINSYKFAPHVNHWAWTLDSDRFCLAHVGGASWDNLKDWIRMWWENRTNIALGGPLPSGRRQGRAAVCVEMFKLATSLQDTTVPWSMLEEVLETAKRAVEAKGRGFAWI